MKSSFRAVNRASGMHMHVVVLMHVFCSVIFSCRLRYPFYLLNYTGIFHQVPLRICLVVLTVTLSQSEFAFWLSVASCSTPCIATW